MVKNKQKFTYQPDGSLDIHAWLTDVKEQYRLRDTALLSHACAYTKQLTQGLTTIYGQPRLEQGLEIADILLSLKLDQEAVATGIICSAVSRLHIEDDKVRKELGESITKLIIGQHKMDAIAELQKHKSGDKIQIDKIRKMLLAMATDIRVVLIKLAERLCFMRGIKSIAPQERQRFAQEIIDLYAPLANRLGIGQIKWELEDLAFRYLEPDTYKEIAGFLAERRTDRENRIHRIISQLYALLHKANIKHAEVTGRAKHIYSIYMKMNRKDLDQDAIYDTSAVRVLVDTLEECYQALSIVHASWTPIIAEFDDYIANPKPNGYRSIHTAVIDADGKHFEIQIRTHDMHEEAERGVAAHWVYKENRATLANEMTKMTYLRQLIDWHQEVATTGNAKTPISLHDDQVYIITPAGDILDLARGATPVDAAYHIHTEVGHRCRGAKVNNHIVPLTYELVTGDRIEIMTIENGAPSRDWMNPNLGFVKTARARSKIAHWFKQQDFERDIIDGRNLLEKELSRNSQAKSMSLQALAKYFHLKNEDELLAAVGRGNIRIGQILHAMQPKPAEKMPSHSSNQLHKVVETNASKAIVGASDFLSRMARCCKPIPGDAIVGYITQGRGISIHKKTCSNIRNMPNPERYIDVEWNKQTIGNFITDVRIIAQDRDKVLHDVTALFANEKIQLLNFNSTANKDHSRLFIVATLQIQSMEQLQHIMYRVQQLPGVMEVSRMKR